MCGKPRFFISGVDTHQARRAISRRLQNLVTVTHQARRAISRRLQSLVTTPEIKKRGFILGISFCATVLSPRACTSSPVSKQVCSRLPRKVHLSQIAICTQGCKAYLGLLTAVRMVRTVQYGTVQYGTADRRKTHGRADGRADKCADSHGSMLMSYFYI